MASLPAHFSTSQRAGTAHHPLRHRGGGSRGLRLNAAAAPSPRPCRCRRCAARVMAFRWGDAADATRAANNPLNAPTPPNPRPSASGTSRRGGGWYTDPTETDADVRILPAAAETSSGRRPDEAEVEGAIEAMQREERVRDVQRAVVEAVEGAQGWWRDLPDKRTVLVGGTALVVGAYLANSVATALDRVPLLPGLLQTVGLGYSVWFWWRFVLFAEGRRELGLSLGHMRRRVAESVEGLAEKTLESHPNPGSGETGAAETARRVVDRMAARHTTTSNSNTQDPQQRRRLEERESLIHDDGSWVDEPAVKGSGLNEGFVAGLLEELDDRVRDLSSGSPPPGSSAVGRRSPSVFALLAVGPEGCSGWLLGPEQGAEEAAAVGGGNPPPGAKDASPTSPSPTAASVSGSPTPQSSSSSSSSSSSPGGGGGGGGPFSGIEVTEVKGIADLDPCLGWDVEACRASGHMKLGEPDNSKLEALEQAALRQARAATSFSRHVDEVLHEPGSVVRGASLESVHLEGDYGRAAGTMERAEMEDLAAKNPDGLPGTAKSTRHPAVGEEAGTGGL